MGAHMKTTVEIADPLFDAAKRMGQPGYPDTIEGINKMLDDEDAEQEKDK